MTQCRVTRRWKITRTSGHLIGGSSLGPHHKPHICKKTYGNGKSKKSFHSNKNLASCRYLQPKTIFSHLLPKEPLGLEYDERGLLHHLLPGRHEELPRGEGGVVVRVVEVGRGADHTFPPADACRGTSRRRRRCKAECEDWGLGHNAGVGGLVVTVAGSSSASWPARLQVISPILPRFLEPVEKKIPVQLSFLPWFSFNNIKSGLGELCNYQYWYLLYKWKFIFVNQFLFTFFSRIWLINFYFNIFAKNQKYKKYL